MWPRRYFLLALVEFTSGSRAVDISGSPIKTADILNSNVDWVSYLLTALGLDCTGGHERLQALRAAHTQSQKPTPLPEKFSDDLVDMTELGQVRAELLVASATDDTTYLGEVLYFAFVAAQKHSLGKHGTLQVVDNRTQVVIEKKDYQAYTDRAKELSPGFDLKGFCTRILPQYKKERSVGFGAGRSYLLAELAGTAHGVGSHRLADIIFLVNIVALQMVSAAAGGDEFDEVEKAMIVEAANLMTPSPTQIGNTPLVVRAVNEERLRELLKGVDVVTMIKDHGTRNNSDHFVLQFAGFCKSVNRVVIVLVSNEVVGKSGTSQAEFVVHMADYYGVTIRGQCTDNATSAIDTQSKEVIRLMGDKLPGG